MTAATAADRARVLGELTAMILGVTGEDPGWAARVTAASRLETDLRLESVEVTALGERIRAAYGDDADLAALLAGLDLDEILALTVGDVADYVLARGAGAGAAAELAGEAQGGEAARPAQRGRAAAPVRGGGAAGLAPREADR